MRLSRPLALLAPAALMLGALPVDAQPLGLAQCMGVAEDAQRLACFDREAALAFPDRRGEAEAARAQAAVQAARRAEQAFGARGERAQSVDEVETSLVEVLSARDRRQVFVLANGQMWRQAEAALVPPVRAGDPVRISRGTLGSFRLSLVRQGRHYPAVRLR